MGTLSGGPSPVIPLLLVGALGWFIYGEVITEYMSYLSELEENLTTYAYVAIPVLLVLIVLFRADVIIIPLLFLLIVSLLRVVLIGPVVLLLLIHLLSRYYYLSSPRPRYWWERPQGFSRRENGDWIGMAYFVLILAFLMLYTVIYEGEDYVWVIVAVALAFLFFFSMF